MLTLEVFIGTISTLAVLATGAFFWILSEIRSERQERRSERESDRKQWQAARDEDQRLWQTAREEDRRLWQTAREEDQKRWQAAREEDQKRWQTAREEDQRERRADTQRILEAIYFHRHDPNTGQLAFYPPTPAPPAAD